MENQHDKIAELLTKDTWTNSERKWVLDYLADADPEKKSDITSEQMLAATEPSDPLDRATSMSMLAQIHKRIGIENDKTGASVIKIWFLRLGVASFLGLMVLGGNEILQRNRRTDVIKRNTPPVLTVKTVASRAKKVLLILSDGSTIAPEEKENGVLVLQGKTRVTKIGGKISYHLAGKSSKELLYNTVLTPGGSQYEIGLEDGTNVWLNAGSSLRFPTSFTKNERRVEVTGEAFFKVAKNTAKPFTVKVNDAEIRVLGTQFNVSAYEDESALKTTLISGKINFLFHGSDKVLKPGQQSQLTKKGKLKVVSGINLDEVMAWKNRMFDFHGADMVTVGRQISRWYNVEVVFDQQIDELFYAQIPRDTDLKDVLKALELTGKVRFQIEGRKIIVTPNT